MIKTNNFFIDNLKTVVFLGYKKDLEKIIEINKNLKIDSLLITNKQKIISKNKIKYYIKKKLDKSFEKLILNNY